MENLENLVNLTDEELDDVAGGLPDWLQTIINLIGKSAETAWKSGGCPAVKVLCHEVLGIWAVACQVIPC